MNVSVICGLATRRFGSTMLKDNRRRTPPIAAVDLRVEPAMHLPIEIKVLDPALYEFGGPPVYAKSKKDAKSLAGACDLVALAVYGQTDDRKPDFSVRTPIQDEVLLSPGQMVYFCVGFAMHIGNPDRAGFIIPRSSSASTGIRLGNTLGYIDPDYQGPIIVGIESRLRRGTVHIARGERICQMYFGPIERAEWKVVDEFSTVTARAEGAYGSTGRI